MKYLGIDYGEKRIGLAISDETGIIAMAISALKVKSLADAVSKIHRIVRTQNIDIVVVGLPLGSKNEETQQSIQTRYFARTLESTNGAEVEFWNEAFSTVQARQYERRKRNNPKNIDSESARIILQEYLDSREIRKEDARVSTSFLPQYSAFLK
ncbi:Holliday junction resolvase RuvX [Candidatus Dojkabacteria bacterium]|nr:Holliday junction resolvase RuvX [Candidatus Dojkabacteria bacterium]